MMNLKKMWLVYQNNKRKNKKSKGTAIIRLIDDACREKDSTESERVEGMNFKETMKVMFFAVEASMVQSSVQHMQKNQRHSAMWSQRDSRF